jgi:hypothetical protein
MVHRHATSAAKPERIAMVTQTASVRGMLDVIDAIKCRDVFTDNGGLMEQDS